MIVNRRRVMGGGGVKPYLRFTALEDGTFKHNTAALEYSVDEGNTWVALAANTDSPTVTAGNSILWRGKRSVGSGNHYFVATGRFDASGNPLSLQYKDNFVDAAASSKYGFYKLFQNCTTLVNAKDIIIPTNITGGQFCMRMFEGCSSLISIPQLPNTSVAEDCYSTMFSGCSSLTMVQLPEGMVSIDSSMFQNCTNLNVSIPSTVTTIGGNAFYSCKSITELTLPSGVTSIGANPFVYMSNLTTVTCLATTPPSSGGNNPFNGDSNLSHIYVPAASVDDYKAAKGWSTYASKIQAIPTT